MSIREKTNAVIAKFLIAESGNPLSEFYYIPQFGLITTNGVWKDVFKDSELKFHKSWDWLMPVVEKIEEMDVVASFEISQPTIYIYASSVESTFKDIEVDIFKSSKIEAVYKAVVQFIEWYNQN